ncbi:MAG: CotH kinase family protein [Clostridia bacterium]|nr:CotH kinase family protein [Clostridia bacterium]
MRFRKRTILLVLALCATCALALLPGMLMPEKEERYHQHLERKEDVARVCEHDDGTFCSHLPLLYVDTGGQKIPGRAYYDEDGNRLLETAPNGEDFITVSIKVTDREGGNNHLTDTPTLETPAQMNIRGQSSRHFIKYGYSLTLVDENAKNAPAEMMGMDAHHDWVIHGPILDKTLIRNYMWYNIGGEIMEYAPNARFFEMFVNGKYEGLYLMVERITAGDATSRLNLSVNKKNNTFTGYCVRLDRGSNEIKDLDTFSMYTEKTNMILNLVYPGTNNITPELKAAIQAEFSEFERMLYSADFNDPTKGYSAYIDVDSFVDYLLINEFTSNYDAGRVSTYLYKDVDGKYKFCIWDFNSACDNYQEAPVDRNGFLLPGGVWFEMLMQDEAFVERVIERYAELRKTYFNEQYLIEYIDATVEYLGPAIDRNFVRWDDAFIYDLLIPIERNPDTYEEALGDLKGYLRERIDWMDRNITMLRTYIVHRKK